MSDDVTQEPIPEQSPRKGLFARHPRLGILIIGLLFILPICAMMVTVFILIALRVLNA